MNNYFIYSDGSCKGTEIKKGGWSAIICDENNHIIYELYGGLQNTTNQRMEIMEVLEGLKSIKEPSNITVVSDSQYVIDTVNNNWLIKIINNPDTFSNVDLWIEMAQLLNYHNVKMVWTKGHANNNMNNRADKLAQFVAKALNLPEDEYINYRQKNRESLVPEFKTWRSDGFDSGQENGEILYSLG